MRTPRHLIRTDHWFPMHDSKYWRERADEVRARGEAMHDPVARQTLLKIAEEYEKLAQRAERRGSQE